VLDELHRARLQDLRVPAGGCHGAHQTPTQALRSRSSSKRQQTCSTSYLFGKLVQASGPGPAGHAGGGRARPHAALRRNLLEGLPAAGACCHKAA